MVIAPPDSAGAVDSDLRCLFTIVTVNLLGPRPGAVVVTLDDHFQDAVLVVPDDGDDRRRQQQAEREVLGIRYESSYRVGV